MTTLRYEGFRTAIAGSALAPLAQFGSDDYLRQLRHGDLPAWRDLLTALPTPQSRHFSPGDVVEIGHPDELDPDAHQQWLIALQQFIPWRKGPFRLFGQHIDTEWRSQLKWQRLIPHIRPLQGRKVLDVGCGNGYHCLRALGEGASLVVGLDPHLPYVMQFALLQRALPQLPVAVLPISLEQLPAPLAAFDTVFSMGVLYHRRSPIDHLLELKQCLRAGGQLVLETLIVEGDEGYSLTPSKRYCRMSNVWFVPSVMTTERWLQRCGFSDIRCIDVSPTSMDEQRSTEWMPFQSLIDGLDANDSGLTIEGLPAPRRAIIMATRP